jgi:hypothetical protein
MRETLTRPVTPQLPPGIPMIDLPDPLFESGLHQRKVCLVCAKQPAETVLRTTTAEIVPICRDCSIDWNIYGYEILKRIKPPQLIKGLLLFKLLHPFQQPTIMTLRRDIGGLQSWAGKMKKWMRRE